MKDTGNNQNTDEEFKRGFPEVAKFLIKVVLLKGDEQAIALLFAEQWERCTRYFMERPEPGADAEFSEVVITSDGKTIRAADIQVDLPKPYWEYTTQEVDSLNFSVTDQLQEN